MSAISGPVLQQLSDPTFSSKKEVCEKKGALGFRNKPISHLGESDKSVSKITSLFAIAAYTEALAKPAGINSANVLANLKLTKQNLLSRTKSAQVKQQIKTQLKSVKTAVQGIDTPAQSKKKSGSEFLTRRIARFVLYKLAQGGSFSALAAGLSLPASIAKDGVAGTASAVFGSKGVLAKGVAMVFGPEGAVHTAATTTGKGLGATAGVIGSMVSSAFMSELLGFLVITEGPGVVGHLARRLTPKPVKSVYNFITPSFIQRGVNFVTHTDKPVAKGLDYVIDGLAVAFR